MISKEQIDIYINKTISGLHYVRLVKNEQGKMKGFLLIDNNNKPILDVYLYIKRCIMLGAAFNTFKRYIYDLMHFYDFMLINNLSPRSITINHLNNFAGVYLRIVDKTFTARDPLERSMLKSIPIRKVYESSKTVDISWQGPDAFALNAIQRMLSSVKEYFRFLVESNKVSQAQYDSLFFRNSAIYILKASKVPFRKNETTPIEYSQVFQPDEMKTIFEYLQRSKENPCSKLYFYLLRITGMRESDPRRLRFSSVGKKKNDAGTITYDFTSLKADIMLIDPKEKIWRIQIKYHPDDPIDLALKRRKERYVEFSDKLGQFEFLMTRALIYRETVMRRNDKNHPYLLVGRSGNRLLSRNMSVLFNKVLHQCGLEKRTGRSQLVLHSFRHTFASNWIKRINQGLKKDIELHLLSKILGHASYKYTLEQYCHFFEEDYRTILKRMEHVQFNDSSAYRVE